MARLEGDPCGYGSILVLREGIIAQGLGLTLGEYCVVMPKYVYCDDPGSPWATPWGARLCRVIRGYGPLGLERAVSASGLGVRYSPLHGAPVPVASREEILLYMHPREALAGAVGRGDWGVVRVVSTLRSQGLTVDGLGLTGSRALGYHHGSSDVDLVVYGSAAEKVYRVFTMMGEEWDPAGKRDLGGLVVRPVLSLSWRRRVIGGVRATWIGVPEEPLLHCPPLRRQATSPDPPSRRAEAVLRVPPGQASALLYPPCAAAEDGSWIVSYEYNIGGALYSGGKLRIRGLASASGNIYYLGLREEPGLLEILEAGR